MSQKKYIDVKDLLENGFIITDSTNNSLTVPSDMIPRDVETAKKQAVAARRTVMNQEELDEAVKHLVRKYPSVEKRWADPPIPNQNICLVSFQPAKGARPDSDGLYGYMKVRGSYVNETDADASSESLIQNVDSYHPINFGYVGQPLPLCDEKNDDWSLETDTISFTKKLKTEMENDMKEKREKEKKDIEEIKQRQKVAQEKTEAAIRGEVDTSEQYLALRLKRANLIFSLYEMVKTLKRYKDTLSVTLEKIHKMDEEYPELEKKFMDSYNETVRGSAYENGGSAIAKFLTGDVPFDLALIPDTLPLMDDEPVQISPFNPDAVDPHETAKEMAIKAESKSDSLASFDRKKRKDGVWILPGEEKPLHVDKKVEPSINATPLPQPSSATPLPQPPSATPLPLPPNH